MRRDVGARPAAPWGRRPDPAHRPPRPGLASHPHPGRAGDAPRRAGRRRRPRGRDRVGSGRGVGAGDGCRPCSAPTTTPPASSRTATRAVAEAWRRARTAPRRQPAVMEALVPSILEQKVTGKQAFGAFRQLVLHHGDPAPGPADVVGELRLHVQPAPATLAMVPSWEWLRLGVSPSSPAPSSPPVGSPTPWSGSSTWAPTNSTAGCGRCRGWACGRAPRCASGPSATPTPSASATTTWPTTSAGRSSARHHRRGDGRGPRALPAAARPGRGAGVCRGPDTATEGPADVVPTHLPARGTGRRTR